MSARHAALAASVALAAALVALASPRPAAAAPPPSDVTFPISIAVALENGAPAPGASGTSARGVPARDDAWIAAQIADANSLYGPLGVRFRWTLRRELPATFAEMHSRADRDSLAPLVEKNVIDVFVVAALEDVDEPGRYRKGVAWTSRPNGARFIILSAVAPQRVLAHELGHFFGNGHTDVPDNLMSYTRTGGPVTFDPAQIERVHAFTERFLASGRLPDIGPARLLP